MAPSPLPGSDLLTHNLLNNKPGQDSGSKDKSLVPNNGKPKSGGTRKPAPAAPAEEPEAESAAPPPPKPKAEPKVKLTDLEWSADKGFFNEKIKISASADLPPELKDITRIEFKVLALTPDGKREQVAKQDAHLKNGNASAEVTLFIPHYKKDGKSLSECDFIFTAKHRDSKEEESDPLPVKQPFATHVHWEKEDEWVGLPAKLLADTWLKDGEEVDVEVTSVLFRSVNTKVKAKGGKLEVPWTPCMCGIVPGADGNLPAKVEFFAEFKHAGEIAVPKKNFFAKVVAHTESHHFSKDYTWGAYSMHADFKQKIAKGAIEVDVHDTVMKAWPGYLVDMSGGGITGLAKGCPFADHRWGRIIGTGDVPTEYHDGKKWVAMPAAFVPADADFTVVGFIKAGGKFHQGGESSAIWPEQFTDYDFDSVKYKKQRADWKADTESRWSRKFVVRPKSCVQGITAGGCGYPVDVKLEMKQVTVWEKRTLALCNGKFRSNGGCYSLEDTDIEMVAHESGHMMGNPDEYVDGGIDATINGDGAVNGIDTTTVMGQSMQLVKKRHYGNFVTIVEKQVKDKAGKKIEFVAADI